jgi:N-acetylglucosamine transport system permease protein
MTAKLNKDFSRYLFIAIFILPTLIGFTMFVIYPMLRGMYYSFYDWSGVTSKMLFLGMDNYKNMLTDPYILKAFGNEFIIIFWKIVSIIFLSLLFAVALTRSKLRKGEKSFYRIIYFFPNILSGIIIANIWSFVYHPSMGLLNSALEKLGLPSWTHAWLGEAKTVVGSLIPVLSWAGVGLFMIIFVAAINGISAELYDSAYIDGAGEWRQLFTIIIPMIWEQIKFSIVTIIITTFSTSYIFVLTMTQGGPNNASQVVGSYIYDQAFKQYHFGYATAIGVVLFIVILIITALTNKLLSREIDT